MISSILGYGDITPLTQDGKVFTLIYGTVGFPLLLVLVADFAKFLSAFVLFLYTSYLEGKAKCWARLRGPLVPEADLSPEGTDNSDESTADRLWRNLEESHYVQIPPTLILIIVILYCCLGGVLLSSYERHWGFWEAMYFAHISGKFLFVI